ncbi:ribosome small subunit-dependent GTPase A [Laceyella tengchongensis]
MDKWTWGWTPALEEAFDQIKEDGLAVGRVTLQHKRLYRLQTEYGELLAELTGRFRYDTTRVEDYPAVGDWVVIRPRVAEGRASIEAVLPRFSRFSRKVAGRTWEEQIVAANVNTVFLVNALNQDFNVRRIERYLTLAWESGAQPVIVLNKADLYPDVSDKVAQVEAVALGVPIHVVSGLTGKGLDELMAYLQPGKTVALLGSSGVGKSTLTNCFLGTEQQEVQAIRAGDDKGKHTTTYRELFLLPQGGCLIDTPGMRGIKLVDQEHGVQETFEEIEQLALSCRFTDCQHQGEPGCAVEFALAEGRLAPKRLANYRKLLRELAYYERKENRQLAHAEKEIWKKRSRQAKIHARK